MSATATLEGPGPARTADAVDVVTVLAATRSGIEARLIETARVIVAATGDRLLVEKGIGSPEELTSTARKAWRAEAKASAVTEIQYAIGLGLEEAATSWPSAAPPRECVG